MLPAYDIDTPERIAMFMAQCGHESNNFRVLNENLNYSAKALNAIFPKYFERAGRDAEEYHRQPEKIANVIYANRMGNGDEESGEGWKYRGRGLIQCTGKDLYKTLSDALNIDLVSDPDLLQEMPFASMSAGWFWNKKGLNALADAKDYKEMTKRINGGFNGLDDRIAKINKALEVLTA